jgi:D,D-heptose 1,7-bisphosphate phosphatase
MRRAVFIDKDGTLLEDVPYNIDPSRFQFTPHAMEGLALLRDAGFGLVLVSNQSGVARGFFSEDDLLRSLAALEARLAAAGVPLLGVYYCPHHPEADAAMASTCDCRKPLPGLLFRAARAHALDLAASFCIGDILNDVEAGNRAGCRTVLLCRGTETEWRPGPFRTPDFRTTNLFEAARLILASATNLDAAAEHSPIRGPAARARQEATCES